MSTPERWDEAALRVVMEEHIPFHRFLGMRFVRADDDGVILRLPFRPELVGDPMRPALHGGVLSALIDTAAGAAAFYGLERTQRVSTVDLVVDYLRPGPLCDIEARARVVRRGNRVCIANCDLVPVEGGEAFARGRGVYNIARTISE